jgi:hypothetical protein
LKCLAVGFPGSGKTWFAASAALSPETSPVLYVEYFGQSASLGTFPGLTPDNFIHIRIDSYDELSYVHTWLVSPRGTVPALDNVIGDLVPKTVVFDSITEIQRMEVLRVGGTAIPKGSLPTSFEHPSIRGWGQLLDQFVFLGKTGYALNLNVIMTCLAQIDFDKDNKVTNIVPALHGQASTVFPSTALTVMRLEAQPAGLTTEQWGKSEPVYNVGYFRVGNAAFARDNSGVFNTSLYNPSVPRMVRLINARTANVTANS